MNRTLALIKPDAVDRNIIGEIIALIEQNGFIVRNMKFMKIIEFDVKWVRMAPYDLILRLDGAQRLRIISKPLMSPKSP